MSVKVIYVAGPYSADNEYGVKQNIARAEALAVEIWKSGGAAICPHLNTAHWGGILPHEGFMRGDLEIVKRCDAVLMVPGWQKSKGANLEFNCAMANRIPVFFNLSDVRNFIAESDVVPA